ncbi:MAG: rubrerythrin family protein [Bacteroidales bacterium]
MKKFYMFLLLIATLGILSSCSSPKPVKTIENLKAAFKGESTASISYAAFAQKAKEEGLPAVAVLFEAIAKAELINAENHAKTLEKLGEKVEAVTPVVEVKSTKENLMAALEGENLGRVTMYPPFIATAKEEKYKEAVTSFSWAMDTDKKHYEFLQSTLTTLDAGDKSTLPANYYVCPKCGNTWDAASVKAECDFCKTTQEKYIKF